MPHKIIPWSILSFSNAVKSIWQIQNFLMWSFPKAEHQRKIIFPCKKYYIYSIHKETGFVFILFKGGKLSLCSSFGLYFPDSDEKLEIHSMTKPYALSPVSVTGKRMKKTLLQWGEPYLFTKSGIFIIYAQKWKTW